jgi:hypothetical protein
MYLGESGFSQFGEKIKEIMSNLNLPFYLIDQWTQSKEANPC